VGKHEKSFVRLFSVIKYTDKNRRCQANIFCQFDKKACTAIDKAGEKRRSPSIIAVCPFEGETFPNSVPIRDSILISESPDPVIQSVLKTAQTHKECGDNSLIREV
jgi:hypothetical protein